MRNIVTKFIVSLVCIFLTNTIVLAKVSVPFTMTESLFNDKSVVVNSEGKTSWGHPEIDGAGLLGVCVGNVSVNIFDGGTDWSDKYVDIAFDGVPDKLSFSGESSALTTDIEWYVKESPNGSSWSSKIWSADTRMVNDVSIQLSANTRYVRLCYSGNFKGCFSDVTITSRYRLKVISNGETIRDEYLSAGAALSIQTPTNIPSCKVFDGWDQEVPSTMPAEDLTLTAQFSTEKYTSTFQLSNAELGVTLPDFTQTFDCDATVSVESPSLKGYTFQGWSPSLPMVVDETMDGQTYVAQWLRNLYNYKVYTVDENVPAIVKQLYYAAAIEPLDIPEREGYEFKGWNREPITSMPDEDVTIKAQWKKKMYRLSVYFSDDDSVAFDLGFGDGIPQVTEPSKEGYAFVGWDKEFPLTMPSNDVVIHALWETQSYRLVVYTTEQDSLVYLKEYEEQLTPLTEPERYGYEFVQWSAVLPNTMPGNDVVIRAIWRAKTYSIVLMLDDKIQYSVKKIAYGDAVDMSDIPEPTRTGYVFKGWDNEFPATMPAENLLYYAQWSTSSYNLILVKNSNDPSENDTLSYEYGDKIKRVVDPERIGYRFIEWIPAIPDSMPNENVVVTAKWEHLIYRYVVYSFDNDSTEIEFHYGDKLPTLKEPEKLGWTFTGWDKTIPTTMPANDLIVRAQWIQNTYNYVVYYAEDDSIVTQYHYGDSIPSLDDPTRVGYDFIGWDVENIKTMPNADFVIKAKWTLAKYNLYLTKGLDFVPSTDTIQITYADPVVVADPSHDGYMFEGWNPSLPEYMPAENVSASAKWSKNKYRYVVYFTENDSIEESVFYGEALEPLEDQSQVGYVFKGWNIEQPATMPANDLIIKAVWEPETYKIDLLVDGEVYFSQLFQFQDSVKLVGYEDPNKPGYSFEGWNGAFPDVMPASNLSYDAEWSVNKYSLIVVNDIENRSLDDTFYVFCDAKIPVIPQPEKTGYLFMGWQDELPETMPAKNIILIAQWSALDYNLVFMNDEEVFLEKKFKYKETIDYKTLAKPVKDGFVFIKWANAPATMPDHDVTLTAVWSANAYRIIVVNDADNSALNDTLYYEYGSEIDALEIPKKAGYSFVEWNVALPATMPAEDLQVIARWSINTYTLTTLVNCKPTSYTYTYGNPVLVNDPQEEGYAFNGWSTDVPTTMPDQNVLLVSDMRLLQYDFITIADEDTTIIKYNFQDSIVVPADPKKDGYTFLSWSENIPAVMPSHDVQVEALWERNRYKIFYVVEDDTLEYEYLYEETISKIADPEKEGYTFMGWNAEVPEQMPSKDLVFEAEWKPNTYSFVVISNEDTIVSKYTYEKAIQMPEEPSKVGYTFAGWNKSIPESMPAHNDTVVALWQINTYEVTWIINQDTIVEKYNYQDTIQVVSEPQKRGATFLGWTEDIPTVMPARDFSTEAEFEWNSYEFRVVIDGKMTTSKYYYQQEIEELKVPEKEGYTFVQWEPSVPIYMPDSSLTVEAQWEINTYELAMIMDEDTVRTYYKYLEKLDSFDIPMKKGHTFVEWIPALPDEMPASDMMVEATWKINYYNFIKVVDKEITKTVYEYGDSLSKLEQPEKKGYTFVGWSDTVPVVMPDSDVTVEAVWKKNQYNLLIVVDSDTTIIPYEYEGRIQPVKSPVKDGFTFVGWNDEIPTLMPANDVIIAALWNRNDYTLSLIVENDTVEYFYSYGDSIKVEDPFRKGYEFQKWLPTLPATMPMYDLSAEAIWTAKSYTLSYIVDQDTIKASYYYDQTILPSSEPAKVGYTFVGWSDSIPANMPARDLQVEAIFKVNSYDLVVTIDDSVATLTYEFGDPIDSLETPSKEGYTFIGWSVEIPDSMPAHDINTKAVWDKDVYNLNVVILTDTITYPYTYGAKINSLLTPGVVGYTFNGWSDTIPTYMPAHDVWIEAYFRSNMYDLILEYMDTTIIISYDYGAEIFTPAIPEVIGYTFDGWLPELPATMPDSNMVVTSQWTVNRYNFTAVMYDDTLKIEYAYGSAIDIPTVADRKGYSFDGWSDSIPEIMPAHGVTVFARYSKNKYNFVVNIAERSDTVMYAYGDSIDKPSKPTREGYTFTGWSKEIPTLMPDSNLTIDALWKAKTFSVTYEVDGVTTVQKYKYGEEIAPVKVEERKGYTFVGWSPELPTTMPAENLKLTPIWELNEYEFTYITHKKEVTERYSYGDSIVKPKDPTRKGHTFVGWSDSIPDVMPDSSIVVSAVWKVKLYNVQIVSDGVVILSKQVPYGESLDLPEKLEKEGWLFMGYDEEIPETMPAKNLIIEANFRCLYKFDAYVSDGILYVKGLSKNDEYTVTDVLGHVIYHGKEPEIYLMKHGIYIVRGRNRVIKVIVQ